MIERAWLESVSTVYTHANCPDGIASALLLNDVLEGVPVVFLAHGTTAYEQLAPGPGMLFVDIIPPEHNVNAFVEAGAIVLDHHEKQREIVERFGERGVYSDEPGVSGALLAFREVWSYCTTPGSDAYERAKAFATLAGVRDTWQRQHADWRAACAQSEALRFYPWDTFARVDSPFTYVGDIELSRLLAIGPILLAKRAESVKQHVTEAYGSITPSGSHLMIVNTIETSDIAEAIGDDADLVIGFKYRSSIEKGVTCTLSMRSHADYDVGAFAKSLKGGGHRAAAGATIPVHVDEVNPYTMIEHLVACYENAIEASRA
jgi:hypothetical protein